jgi:hypothetical protein
MSHVKQGPCHHCGSSDAYTTYPDGSAWCFSCETFDGPKRYIPPKEKDSGGVSYDDLGDLTIDCLRMLDQYGIATQTQHFRYSPQRRRLVFEAPTGYQTGRRLCGTDGPKWLSTGVGKPLCYFQSNRGEVECIQLSRILRPQNSIGREAPNPSEHDPLHTRHRRREVVPASLHSWAEKEEMCVIVEDVFSAIKVALYCPSFCTFGTQISPEQIKALRRRFNKLVVWWDCDAQEKARKACELIRKFGIPSGFIVTQFDPKDQTSGSIQWNVDKHLLKT